jgi:ABC-type antimicrobial peptide transport system permease subunit
MGMSRTRLRLVILIEVGFSLLISFALALPLAAACSYHVNNSLLNPVLLNWTGFALNTDIQWVVGLVLVGGFTCLALALCLPLLIVATRQNAGFALTQHR